MYPHMMYIQFYMALESLYNSQIYEKDAEKRCVLRCDLNICEVLSPVHIIAEK